MSTPLWLHQTREIDDHCHDARRFLFWEPRCGKTRAITKSLGIWMRNGVSRTVIAAPLISCRTVWGPELEDEGIEPIILDRGTHDGIATIKRHKTGTIVVNYDILGRQDKKARRLLLEALRRWKPQAVVFDETHLLRAAGGAASNAAHLLAKDTDVRYVRGLTGTPVPRHYGNLYAQFRAIAPDIFGTNFENFAQTYLVRHPRYPSRIMGYQNLDDLKAKLRANASMVRRADCFDLPEVQEIVRKIELEAPMKALYRKIVEEHVAELQLGGESFTIDGRHIFPRLVRLHELAGGTLKLEDGRREWVHDRKLRMCLEEVDGILTSPEQRVVIFYRYVPEGERLERELRAVWGPVVGRIHGEVVGDTRERLIANFNRERGTGTYGTSEQAGLRIMLVQEQTGSISISLRGADHAIFYSSWFDQSIHTQARDRIFKELREAGHKLTYTYLLCTGTLDVTIARVLRNRREAQDKLIFSDYRMAALGERGQ